MAQTNDANQVYADEHHSTFVQHRSQDDAGPGDLGRLAQVFRAYCRMPRSLPNAIQDNNFNHCRYRHLPRLRDRQGAGISAGSDKFSKSSRNKMSPTIDRTVEPVSASAFLSVIDGHDDAPNFVSEVGNGTEFYFNLPRHNNAVKCQKGRGPVTPLQITYVVT